MAKLTIAAAREAVRAIEAQRLALVAQVAALKAQRAPAQLRLDRYQKRRAAHPIVVYAGANEWTRSSMALLRGDAKYGVPADAKPKDIPALVLGGSVKVSISSYGYGQSYTARGLAKRVVTPTPTDLKAWDRATKARIRAEEALRKAKAGEVAAAKEAFANGIKVGLDELVADIAADVTLRVALGRVGDPAPVESDINRMIDGQFGKLTIAKRHLAHLVAKEDDATCSTCQWAKRQDDEAAERKARIETGERRKFTCPEHGKKIGYLLRERGWVKLADDRQEQRDCPVIYCPVDLARFLHKATLDADRAAEARELRGKLVEFTCPNPECGETVQAAPDHHSMIVCPTCEVEWDARLIRTVKAKRAA